MFADVPQEREHVEVLRPIEIGRGTPVFQIESEAEYWYPCRAGGTPSLAEAVQVATVGGRAPALPPLVDDDLVVLTRRLVPVCYSICACVIVFLSCSAHGKLLRLLYFLIFMSYGLDGWWLRGAPVVAAVIVPGKV